MSRVWGRRGHQKPQSGGQHASMTQAQPQGPDAQGGGLVSAQLVLKTGTPWGRGTWRPRQAAVLSEEELRVRCKLTEQGGTKEPLAVCRATPGSKGSSQRRGRASSRWAITGLGGRAGKIRDAAQASEEGLPFPRALPTLSAGARAPRASSECL